MKNKKVRKVERKRKECRIDKEQRRVKQKREESNIEWKEGIKNEKEVWKNKNEGR